MIIKKLIGIAQRFVFLNIIDRGYRFLPLLEIVIVNGGNEKKFGKCVIQPKRFVTVGKDELCAGVCEKEDASPLVSAQRELWEETGYGKGNWQEYMVISANPSTHTNLTYCFLATDVELIDHQHLEATEDISVHLLTLEEVRSLLDKNEIMQALNAAPLWKYIANL